MRPLVILEHTEEKIRHDLFSPVLCWGRNIE